MSLQSSKILGFLVPSSSPESEELSCSEQRLWEFLCRLEPARHSRLNLHSDSLFSNVGYAHMPSMPMRRKKWTEEEEATLIAKYGELLQSGFLSKMKSRERKFEPIASHVNVLFHSQNPVAYPWQWTWKDASTKVQNMRHQYLGVKQKIRRIVGSLETGGHEEFDWEEGLTHWSNFLKYKEVFGDQELDVNEYLTYSNARSLAGRSRPRPAFRPSVHSLPKELAELAEDGAGLVNHAGQLLLEEGKEVELDDPARVEQVVLEEDTGDLGLGVGFEYDGEGDENGLKDGREDYDDDDDETMDLSRRRKRKHWRRSATGLENSISEPRMLAFIASQFAELREREARREERELEREKRELVLEAERAKQKEEWDRDRQELQLLRQKELERRVLDREEAELKREMQEQQRREFDRERERAWEEKMERDKMEWKEKIETQALQHQAAMMQIQSQIVQSQQSTVAMLVSVLLQSSGQGNDMQGHGSLVSPFISQLLQNLQHHGNGMVQCGIRRGAGESSDSHFDVDG